MDCCWVYEWVYEWVYGCMNGCMGVWIDNVYGLIMWIDNVRVYT